MSQADSLKPWDLSEADAEFVEKILRDNVIGQAGQAVEIRSDALIHELSITEEGAPPNDQTILHYSPQGRSVSVKNCGCSAIELTWLANNMKGKAAEIGTACGASAGAMVNVEHLICIDTWAATSDPCFVTDQAMYQTFIANLRQFPHQGRVSVWKTDSLSAAKSVPDQSLDSVFIDASHAQEDVRADIAAWRQKIRPGGLLCGHDYGNPDWPGVKIEVDSAFGSRVRSYARIWYIAADLA